MPIYIGTNLVAITGNQSRLYPVFDWMSSLQDGLFGDLPNYEFLKARNSGHLQIMDDADPLVANEIEVQSPLSWNNNIWESADWDVLWSDGSGNGRPVVGDPDAPNTDYYNDPSRFEKFELNFLHENDEALWSQMISVADSIQEVELLYALLTQNSNSFVTSVMWVFGIDVPSMREPLMPNEVEQLPGIEANVINEVFASSSDVSIWLSLIGVGSDRDIFNGGLGSDRVFGNGGADYLSGGSGTNTLVGGEGADHFALGNQFWLIDQVTGDVGRSSVPNALFLRE